MKKIITGLTTIYFILGIIFSGSIFFFIFGYFTKDENGLLIIGITFSTGLLSAIFAMKYKSKIDTIINYGLPIYEVSFKIREIIAASNILGIEKLQTEIDKSIKTSLKKIIEENKE